MEGDDEENQYNSKIKISEFNTCAVLSCGVLSFLAGSLHYARIKNKKQTKKLPAPFLT